MRTSPGSPVTRRCASRIASEVEFAKASRIDAPKKPGMLERASHLTRIRFQRRTAPAQPIIQRLAARRVLGIFMPVPYLWSRRSHLRQPTRGAI